MKNIHVLPTDKPSIICKLDNVLVLSKIGTLTNDTKSLIRQNIYITNDEEIKDGDWCLSKTNEVVRFGKKFTASLYKKIILTTDQDLINNGVQAIDDEFLEWFVKNPSCEEVKVELHVGSLRWSDSKNTYKIIIPKEEPKQEFPQLGTKEFNNLASAYFGGKTQKQPKQTVEEYEQQGMEKYSYEPKKETLEEASSRLLYSKYPFHPPQDSGYWKDMFLEGAKWQQEQDKKMYSEEELPKNLESVLAKITHQNDLGLSQWYEVVYYDNDTEKWCCYSGGKTFQDGERVIEWKYCKDCL